MEANTAAQAANEKAKTTFWQERKPKWWKGLTILDPQHISTATGIFF
jgi:hypothetical protein